MGRDAVRMSPDEVADFLAGQLKVQVGSNGPDGTPHLTTLFYVLDEGRIVADGPPGEVLTPDLVRRVFGVAVDEARTPDGRRHLALRGS